MEIKASKLFEVMTLLKPAIAKKSTIKSVACVCLHDGKAIATDLETMVIANLPEATESILLPYAEIVASLTYIPGNDIISIDQSGKTVMLRWSNGESTYPTPDFADFPVLPELAIKAEGLVDGDMLLAALKSALPYAAADDTRPVLHGITLVLGSPVEVAAGDGFRACHQTLGMLFPSYEGKIVLPLHGVTVMEHIFAKTPRTPPSTTDSIIDSVIAKRYIHLSMIGENKMRLDFGTSASIIMNLIAGEPPKWMSLIPTGDAILQSQIFAPQFEAAVKRVQTVAKGGSGIVRLEFADGKLKVSAKGGDQEISTTIDTILTQGEPGKTAINVPYLLDVLNKKTGIITLTQYTDTGPIVFEYGKTPKVLIMPMAVNWETGKPPEAPTTVEEPKADIVEDVDETAEEPEDSTAETETAEETVAATE